MNLRTIRHVIYALTFCVCVLAGALSGATCGIASVHRDAVRGRQ